LVIARLSVARSAWFSILAIIATIAVVAAYNERTRVPLFGTIAGLFALETFAYLFAGTGLLGVVTGTTTGGVAVEAALAAAAGNLVWIVLLTSVAVMLAHPGLDAPFLDYDSSVEETAETTAGALGRPSLTRSAPFGFGAFVLRSMEAGARTATPIVVAVAAVGIIPGVLSATGLAPNLTTFITSLAGGSTALLLLITAIAAIILGMGVPTTATYILLASVLAPAIVQSGEIPVLAAHLFILYFGVIADITPPVAVAAYAAAGVAKSDPFPTGVEAFTLSLNKAIVPFAFAFTPGIVLLRSTGDGTARVITAADVLDIGFFVPEVVVPIAGTFLGVVALGPTIIGYLYTTVPRSERALFAASAVLLMTPLTLFTTVGDLMALVSPYTLAAPPLVGPALRGLGVILFGALALKNRRAGENKPGTTTTAEPATD
ncbi:MAG: TRAP transporter large permease subunit, partial [Halalkalicoccus sp.]|nr:TRAP transporter large permease subunit [Halalkalicoccus sp.]